jgi:hypothetical protein
VLYFCNYMDVLIPWFTSTQNFWWVYNQKVRGHKVRVAWPFTFRPCSDPKFGHPNWALLLQCSCQNIVAVFVF